MKIEGLKPTHVDIHTGLYYAQHALIWYIVKPISFDGHEYQWTESYDYNEYPEEVIVRLQEIQ
jgi:hypothetical protein